MKVCELIERLRVMNDSAEVVAIAPDGEFYEIIDCESEFSDEVSLGLRETDNDKTSHGR